jgi:hypothetical protein
MKWAMQASFTSKLTVAPYAAKLYILVTTVPEPEDYCILQYKLCKIQL